MTDNAQKPIDLDTLSDEEFMKLNPNDLQAYTPPEGDSNVPDPNVTPIIDDPDSDVEPSGSEGDKDPQPDDENGSEEKAPVQQPFKESGAPANPVEKPDGTKTPEKTAPVTGADTKNVEPKSEGKKSEEPAVTSETAVSFFKLVTAPFKADGKDIQIRSADDAIRLMQMGVNYSRRMQEMKPLRAQHEMLKTHGLDSPEKLNFAIELMQGKPEAIQKLLKDKKIDPIDIDTTKEVVYKPSNYQSDVKTLAFKEAIDQTLATEGGPELISDINKSWDDVSKEALKDQPAIFQNLLDQKRSGVYVKIKKELDYQRTLGFLTNVPFVQAYHQVGEAMQKAGVFGPNLTPKPKMQVQSQVQPLDTGTRKAAQNSGAPAPNLSSTQQPRIATPQGNSNSDVTPDYWAMSDEDFLKLKPPS